MLPDSGFLVGTFQPVSDPLDFPLPIEEIGSYSENGSPDVISFEYAEYIAWLKDGGAIVLGTGDGSEGNVGSEVRLIVTRVGGVVLLDAYLMPPTTYIQLSEACPDTTVLEYIEECSSGIQLGGGVDNAVDVDFETETGTTIVEI